MAILPDGGLVLAASAKGTDQFTFLIDIIEAWREGASIGVSTRAKVLLDLFSESIVQPFYINRNLVVTPITDSQGRQPVGPQEMHYQTAPVEEYLLAFLP
jgi:hypothetical protein